MALGSLLASQARANKRRERRERKADRSNLLARAAVGILAPAVSQGVTSLINAPFREPIRKFLELDPQGRELDSTANKLWTQHQTITQDIKDQTSGDLSDKEWVQKKAYDWAEKTLTEKYNAVSGEVAKHVNRPDVWSYLSEQGVDFDKEAAEWAATKKFYYNMPFGNEAEFHSYLQRGTAHPKNWGEAAYNKIRGLFSGQNYEAREKGRLADHYTNLLGLYKDPKSDKFMDTFGHTYNSKEEAYSSENVGKVLSSLQAGTTVLGYTEAVKRMHGFGDSTYGKDLSLADKAFRENRNQENTDIIDGILFRKEIEDPNSGVSKRVREIYTKLSEDAKKTMTLSKMAVLLSADSIDYTDKLNNAVYAGFSTSPSENFKQLEHLLYTTAYHKDGFDDLPGESYKDILQDNPEDAKKLHDAVKRRFEPIARRVSYLLNVYGESAVLKPNNITTQMGQDTYQTNQILGTLDSLIGRGGLEISNDPEHVESAGGRIPYGFLGFGMPKEELKEVLTGRINDEVLLGDSAEAVQQSLENSPHSVSEKSNVKTEDIATNVEAEIPVKKDETFEVTLEASMDKLQSDKKKAKNQAVRTVVKKAYENDIASNPDSDPFEVGMNIVNMSRSTDTSMSDNRKLLTKAVVDAKDVFVSQPFVEEGDELTVGDTLFKVAEDGQINVSIPNVQRTWYGGTTLKSKLYNDLPEGNIKNYIRYLSLEHNKLKKATDPLTVRERRNIEDLIDLPGISDSDTIREIFKLALNDAQTILNPKKATETIRDSLLGVPTNNE